MENEEKRILPDKFYGKTELAQIYGVDWRTLKKYLSTRLIRVTNSMRNLPPPVVSDIKEDLKDLFNK